jgi:hypothetical protein
MPYEVAIQPIEDALRALLVASSPLTALLATKKAALGGGPAIYAEGTVPQDRLFPYLTIGAWTQVGAHTLGITEHNGWNCTGQIKAVSQTSEAAARSVMSKVFAVLYEGRRLSVSGYGSAWCGEFNLQPVLITAVAGITSYELPAILRVGVHDS